MSELSLVNVNKTFPGGVQAVYDFSLAIEHGEFIVLVGPSGCGKTTVLRMIAGLETVTEGELILSGKRVNNVAPADRDISMVFQDYALYGHMSVYQNMAFSQIIRSVEADVIHEKVMDAARVVDLEHQLNRFPRNLSGGQRQRVALGRATVSSARVILMDEPLSNLDAKLRVQARRELKKLHQQLGNTFLYVTHDQTEAMTMADRIVIMEGGRIQQVGTPIEVYHSPENIFVGGFIGSPPMSFVKGRIEECRFIAPGMNLSLPPEQFDLLKPFLISSRHTSEVILGVRPENFQTEPVNSSQVLTGMIEASEFLGNRSLVYLDIAGNHVVASLANMIPHTIGETMDVFIDMHSVHFFDPVSERRIRQERRDQ